MELQIGHFAAKMLLKECKKRIKVDIKILSQLYLHNSNAEGAKWAKQQMLIARFIIKHQINTYSFYYTHFPSKTFKIEKIAKNCLKTLKKYLNF